MPMVGARIAVSRARVARHVSRVVGRSMIRDAGAEQAAAVEAAQG